MLLIDSTHLGRCDAGRRRLNGAAHHCPPAAAAACSNACPPLLITQAPGSLHAPAMALINNAGGSLTSAVLLTALAWGVRWLRAELNRKRRAEERGRAASRQSLGRFSGRLSPVALRMLVSHVSRPGYVMGAGPAGAVRYYCRSAGPNRSAPLSTCRGRSRRGPTRTTSSSCGPRGRTTRCPRSCAARCACPVSWGLGPGGRLAGCRSRPAWLAAVPVAFALRLPANPLLPHPRCRACRGARGGGAGVASGVGGGIPGALAAPAVLSRCRAAGITFL